MAKYNIKQLLYGLIMSAMITTCLFGCGNGGEAVPIAPGVSDKPEIAAFPSLLADEFVEAQTGKGRQMGTGFTDFNVNGELSDVPAAVTKYARPIRRVVKQDVYGRVLTDDFYFYRNMLSDGEQKLYDQIYANAIELDPEFDIASTVHINKVYDVYMAVRFDNPDLFWLDTNCDYSYDNNGYITSMRLGFFDFAAPSVIEQYKYQFYSAADSILEQAMGFGNDIDKVKYCHDFLTMYCVYNLDAPYNQSAYSALCEAQTVCAGFTYAFQYLMQRLGIPCAVVNGDAYWPGPVNAGSHVWNLIKIDGAYYEMDVTWNNNDTYPENNPGVFSYDYFNITTDEISYDHMRYAISEWLPAGTGITYSYPNYYGDSPGSDLYGVSYGYPIRALPPVYPDGGNDAVQSWEDYGYEYSYEDEDAGGEYGYEFSYQEVEAYVDSWSDDDWDEWWGFFEDEFSEEFIEELDDMDWDEFIDFMYELMNG